MRRTPKALTVLAGFAVAATLSAQPSRTAWTRSSSSSDIAMDAALDGLVNADGNFVLAGSSKQPNGTSKGNITILARNRALRDFVEVSPPGGGSLVFHKIIWHDGFYYAIGEAVPTGSQNSQLYVGKFDANLDLHAEKMQGITAAGGGELPTDVAVDPNGRIYICGIGQSGTSYESFLTLTDILVSSLSMNFPTVPSDDFYEPQITTNGIIAILIGLFTNNEPQVRSYTPGGTLNWSFGQNNAGSQASYRFVFEDVLISSYCYVGTGWTESTQNGFRSYGKVTRIDVATGQASGSYQTPYVDGAGIVSPRDSASGQATGKRVNFLFDQGNRARLYSFNAGITAVDDWISPTTSAFSAGLLLDQYDEAILSLCENQTLPAARGCKLNINNDLRFSWGLSQTGLLLPYMEASNLYEPSSGDILSISSDLTKFNAVCVQQAPVAVTNGVYQAKSGKLFRPAASVLANDRYAGGAAITITQQPAHGTVTMGANGFFNYTSATGYVGPDSFKYTLTKVGLNPSTATVNLNVKP